MSDSRADVTRRASNMAFWWRLADNLFRRLPWFLLPIIALAPLGLSQARNTPEFYRSSATLSASTNPLVPEQQIGEAAGAWWETPAGATSRIINERLRTDSFLAAVIERADLSDAIEQGLLTLDVVRTNLWASANGNTIFTINAQWDAPATSQSLVAATIDTYQEFLENSVASASSAAETFYTEQLDGFVIERDHAQDALSDFVTRLPPLENGGEHPLVVQIDIDRLGDAVRSAESRIDEAQANIDSARLARMQLTTEAGRSLTVIDQPRLPNSPESTIVDRLITVAMYTVLGFVIAAIALIVTTVLDRSVASVADLQRLDEVVLVTVVPPVRLPDRTRNRRSTFRGQRRRRREPAIT